MPDDVWLVDLDSSRVRSRLSQGGATVGPCPVFFGYSQEGPEVCGGGGRGGGGDLCSVMH